MSTIVTRNEGTGRRVGLDRDEVIQRALDLIERDGSEALTMRALAAELGVTTTTIYWHVGGREELLTAVIELLSRQQAEAEILGEDPGERVFCIARQIWTNAQAHRNVTSLAHRMDATTLLEMPMELAMLREFESAGVRGAKARDALQAIIACVAGFLVMALRSPASGSTGIHGTEIWSTVEDDSVSATTLKALTKPSDLETLFNTTITAVIDQFVPDSETAACDPGNRDMGDLND